MSTNQPTNGGATAPPQPMEQTMVKFTNKNKEDVWFNVLRIESIREKKEGCVIVTVSNLGEHVLESMDEVIKIIEEKMLQLVGGVK